MFVVGVRVRSGVESDTRDVYFGFVSSGVYATLLLRMALDADDSVDVVESELVDRAAFLCVGEGSGPDGRLLVTGVFTVFR